MSKNVAIAEGGTAKTFSGVAKLRTALVGGGTCDWVPQDDANDFATVTTLTATENGVYTPPAGTAGYSAVTVDVPNTGGYLTGADSDGNLYKLTVSGDTLSKTKIPSAIAVTAPPTLRTYAPGHAIDFTGLTVKLYDGAGDLFTNSRYPDGVVPHSELTFPITTAPGSENGQGGR